MAQSLRKIIGFTLEAIDGKAGKVQDVYFDDVYWQIHYLIIQTGGILEMKQVIIPPHAIDKVDWEKKILYASLSKEKVKSSPDPDTRKTVSRMHEIAMFRYHQWPYYWANKTEPPKSQEISDILTDEEKRVRELVEDSSTHVHLRSLREVLGYHVEVNQRKDGQVHDFIIDEKRWTVCVLEVGSGGWFSHSIHSYDKEQVDMISWMKKKIMLHTSSKQVQNAVEHLEI
ncbi:MAG: PRC-barrel domain-containing protein [Fibrobacterota bacterium]